MEKTFYIIDGNSFAYRAFYALPPLTTKDGIEIQAVFGFYNMIQKIIKEKKPDYIALTFDHPGPTKRHKMFADYKIQREKMPESLQNQMRIIKDIAEKGKMPYFEKEGYEADDIIAAMANNAQKETKVVILTGDKDMLQLVNKNISVMKIKKDEDLYYTPDKIKDEYGFEPANIVDVLALMGDSSDNIPGVKGIGEKTAYKLIHEFKDVENLIKNIAEIKQEKLQKLVEKNIENIRLSRRLAVLNPDEKLINVIQFDIKQCSLQKIDTDGLNKEFLSYNFKTLVGDKSAANIEVKVNKVIKRISSFKDITAEIKKSDELIILYSGMENAVELISAEVDDKYYFIIGDVKELPPEISNKSITTNSIKNVYKLINKEIDKRVYDLAIMSYLLDPDKSYKDLSHVLNACLGETFISFEDIAGKGAKKIDVHEVDSTLIEKYVFSMLAASGQAKEKLYLEMEKCNLKRVYTDIEIPLARVLAEMEKTGIKIDGKYLKQLISKTGESINELERGIYKDADSEFNINSPKQLGELLFEKMNLPKGKKTKTGYSTDVEVLESLSGIHPVIDKILKYRSLNKFKNSYLDVIKEFIDNDNKIYPIYNQTIAATGRLSTSRPNIQSTPVRDDEGREIRKIFIPLESGHTVISADYSQIELRVLAHFSKDKKLIQAFKEDIDIHSLTASEIFNVLPGLVTKEQRRAAKTINFGIVYGISPFGLSKQLKISNHDSQDYINRFFATFPGVKKYQNDIIQSARENGFVETLSGRRRYVPNIRSENRTIREFAERATINAPIQGTAADIIKIAMINILNRFNDTVLRTKMILQIHDELVFSTPPDEKEKVKVIIKELMENTLKIDVPLIVSIGEGENWYECG